MLARERLREAQQAEATATAAVYDAQDALEAATAKRDDLLGAASAEVTEADAALSASYAELVAVSGIDRSGLLLGMTKAELRRAVKGDPKSAAATRQAGELRSADATERFVDDGPAGQWIDSA